MVDTPKIPPELRAELLARGFDDDVIDLFSLEEAEKYSRYTPEEMRKILNGGRVPSKSDEDEQFLAAFESDKTSAPGEPARDAQNSDETPTTGAENSAPENEAPAKPNGGSQRPAADYLTDLDPAEVGATPVPAPPELTLFVNTHGALTKQFALDANGDLVKTEGGKMATGTARRIAIDNAQALADLIGILSSDQALALGSMRAGLPAQVTVITKEALNGVTAP